MKRKLLLLTTACVLLVLAVVGGCCKSVCSSCPFASQQAEETKITLVAPVPDAVLAQNPAAMRDFLQKSPEEREKIFNAPKQRAELYKQHRSEANLFAWECPEELRNSARLHFSLTEDFKTKAQELILKLDRNQCQAQVCNFYVGKTIYWKVTAKDADGREYSSAIGHFRTEDVLPRQITLPGVDNVRDLGGWKTADGRRMRQGMIFRSAGLNEDSPDWTWDKAKRIDPLKSRIGKTVIRPVGRRYFVKNVGIKTDLDLRWDGEVATMTESPLGAPVRWVHISSQDYGGLFKPEGLTAARECFKIFADKKNYPIVFHCIAGADRTGTLAFILCGLVGVDPDDLRKDWEVTARDYFSYAKYGLIAPGFDKYGSPDDPLSVKIENFLLSIGVTQAEIDQYKEIILE